MPRPAEEYAQFRRDSVAENELCSELRRKPEEHRLDFLRKLLPVNPWLAAESARRSTSDPEFFEALLRHFVECMHGSNARGILPCVVPRLGFRKVVRVLANYIETRPANVRFAFWELQRERYRGRDGYDVQLLASLKRSEDFRGKAD